MKKTLAVAFATLTLAGLVAGCGQRADKQGRGDSGNTTQEQQTPTEPAQAQVPGKIDTGSVDAELGSVDALLSGADDDLAAADKTPEDSD